MELLLTSDWGRPLERGLTLCSQADRSVRITYPLGQTFPPVFSPPLSCADAASPPRAIPSSARLGCLRGAARTSGCAGRGQGISVPGGTDPAWACSSIREDHERVFGWGQQLFVIPHPGFKYNCLLQMND